MKSILYSIYFLIRVHYPSDDIATVRYYNKLIDDAVKSYCFLDIEYDITTDPCKDVDLELYTIWYGSFINPELLGVTKGSILNNKKIGGVPYIRLSYQDNAERRPYILTHEFGHFLGLNHSMDTLSLMYPYFNWDNTKLSRHDSLILVNIYTVVPDYYK